MKKALLIILIALIGVGILLYPTLASYLSDINGTKAIEGYDAVVNKTDAATKQAMWDAAVMYNETLSGDPAHDPFIPGTGMAMPDNYYKVLSLAGDGSDSMGSIEIPKINVNLPIYHGTSDAVLEKGVGHLEGSSMPVGGSGTHCVLTGHTGLTNAKLFTDLIDLKEGDVFFLHVLGQTLAYQVDQIKVVLPDVLDDLKREPGKDYCTLVTCTPYGINDHRLMVRGIRIDYTPEIQQAAQSAAKAGGLTQEQKTLYIAGGITTAVMTGLIILVLILRRKRGEQAVAAVEKESEIGLDIWYNVPRKMVKAVIKAQPERPPAPESLAVAAAAPAALPAPGGEPVAILKPTPQAAGRDAGPAAPKPEPIVIPQAEPQAEPVVIPEAMPKPAAKPQKQKKADKTAPQTHYWWDE